MMASISAAFMRVLRSRAAISLRPRWAWHLTVPTGSDIASATSSSRMSMTAFSTSALRWSGDSRSSESRSAASTPIGSRSGSQAWASPAAAAAPSTISLRRTRATRRAWSVQALVATRCTQVANDASPRIRVAVPRRCGRAPPARRRGPPRDRSAGPARCARRRPRGARPARRAPRRSPPRARAARIASERVLRSRRSRSRARAVRSTLTCRVRSIRAAIVGDVARPGSSLSSARFGRHASAAPRMRLDAGPRPRRRGRGCRRGLHRRRRSPDRRPRPARPHVGRRAR